MRENFDPDKLIAALDELGSFRGTNADLEKVRLYYEIKDDIKRFAETCPDVLEADGFDPNPRERHAVLWITFKDNLIVLNAEETAALASVMGKADGTVFSASDKALRISFDVKDVWKN